MTGDDLLVAADVNQTIEGNNESVTSILSTDRFDLPLVLRFGISDEILVGSFLRLLWSLDAVSPNDNANYINSGFIDTFRIFNKDEGHYTWWSYMFNSRAKNVGWRIDYFCVSELIKNKIKKSIILPEVMGSDHAPILIEIDE